MIQNLLTKELDVLMKIIQVHGTPSQRLNVYGTLLLLLGMVLTFITIELVGLFVSSLGSWLCWYALKQGADKKRQWMSPLSLFGSICMSGVVIFFLIRMILGR